MDRLKLAAAPLCFVLINTTGLNVHQGGEIFEIGVLRTRYGQIEKSYHSFVKTSRAVPENILSIKKLSEEDVQGAKELKEVIKEAGEILKGTFILGIHTTSLLQFLDAAFRDVLCRGVDNIIFDIQILGKELLEKSGYLALKDLAEYLGIEEDEPARTEEKLIYFKNIFDKMLPQLASKGVESVLDLRNFQKRRISLSSHVSEEQLQTIKNSIKSQTSLEFSYFSPYSGNSTHRKVDPYELRMKNRSWYIIGWCHLKTAYRFFSLERITELEETTEAFEKKEDYSLPDFFK